MKNKTKRKGNKLNETNSQLLTTIKLIFVFNLLSAEKIIHKKVQSKHGIRDQFIRQLFLPFSNMTNDRKYLRCLREVNTS